MRVNSIFKVLIIALMLFIPLNAYSGGESGQNNVITTDSGTNQLVSYYDLRSRESYVQVSNTSSSAASIHVQILRNDFVDCNDIDFYDTLTGNDTHIYNMRNLVGNALPVNVTLSDISNGMVVITLVDSPNPGSPAVEGTNLIGNFRIVDSSGYEYRSNSAGVFGVGVESSDAERLSFRYTLNFNQLGGNNQSDVVGVEIQNVGAGFSSVNASDLDTIAFVVDDGESSTSCDEFEFDCGGEAGGVNDFLSVGINDLFPSTNGDQAICAGNTTSSGFVDLLTDEINTGSDDVIVGFIGLNNGNGTGSMDSWVGNNFDICEFLEDDFDGDCGDSLLD